LSSEHGERRLAAILAADVAGSCRLIGIDEEGTLTQLKALRKTLFDPKITQHRGRIVKNTGDGALVEFASAVDAARCALEIQRDMAQNNADTPQERRIEFRIGIHVGDIIIDDNDIFGDGVNIAVRLEGIAEPGGICISEDAYRHLRGKVDTAFIDRGEQQLKNIVEPVHVYAVAPLIGARQAASAPTSTPTPRLSIIVLPFENLGGDAEQDYFADGLTEDLTSELSRLHGAFVIARNTAFTFKGKSIDVKQLGREIGVRYVLEGSVRKAGQRVRVAAQLIDAETGANLWADRFDRDLSDLFSLQDAITVELARVLAVRLVEVESRRSERSSSPDAFDLVMRARAFRNRGTSRENYARAASLYEQALQLSPDDVQALKGLSVVLAGNSFMWSEARDEDLRRAEALAARASILDPYDAQCHVAMGLVRRMQNRLNEAISEFEAAIRLNPNMPSAHAQLGLAKVFSGRGEDALPCFVEAIRLSPRDPQLFLDYLGIGMVRFLRRDDDGAIEMLHKAIALNPNFSSSNLFLIAAYAMQDRVDEAKAALASYLRSGTATNTIALARASAPSIHPGYLTQRERLYEGLRKAGMPEE
jgi:TolB-like protein/cytochrome c-type biogenesis protein CcmH/NrfG